MTAAVRRPDAGARARVRGPAAWAAAALLLMAAGLHAQASVYRVTFSDEDRRLARVDATLATADSVLLVYPYQYDASHLPEGWATFVRSMTATDAAGDPVPLRKSGLARWRIPAGAKRPLRLSYEVLVHHDQGYWPVGWDEAAYASRQCDCVFLTGMSLFVGAEDLADIGVEFDLPGPRGRSAGWISATPWEPAPQGGHSYRVPDFRHLGDAGLVVGRVPVADVRSGDAVVRVAVGKGIPDGLALFQDATSRYLAAAEQVFGSAPRGRFLVVANPDVFTGGGAFIRTVSMLFRDPVTREGRAEWGHVLAHELVHLWNGHGLRFQPDEEWFKEGVTDYLSRKLQLGVGDLSDDALMERLAEQYGYYLAAAGRVSLRRAGHDKQANTALVYGGAAATGFALDVAMREASGGRAGIEELMRALYARHAGRGPLTTDQIEREASRLAGRSFRSFFRDYVSGTEVLPLADFAGRIGYRLETSREGDAVRVRVSSDPGATPDRLRLRRWVLRRGSP
ncbi:MAG TPA: hypothetical protein VHG51_01495 [Longimicrobiaceae bacterium]|nr:hypothetical protein [Longimicrobiaceae bacterium]